MSERCSEQLSLSSLEAFRNHQQHQPLRPFLPLDFEWQRMRTGVGEDAARQKTWILHSNPPIELDGIIPWEDSRHRNRTWSFRLHCWELLNDELARIGRAASTASLDSCLRIAEEWIGLYREPKDVPADSFAWNGMAAGKRATRLSFLIDVVARRPEYGNEQLMRLLRCAEQHRLLLSDRALINLHNNHGIFQVSGQLDMCRRLSFFPSMESSIPKAELWLSEMIAAHFTAEGVHREHSPDYQRMMVQVMQSLTNHELTSSRTVTEVYPRAEQALAHMVKPNRSLVNFGDTHDRDMTLAPEDAARRWMTSAMVDASSCNPRVRPQISPLKAYLESGYAFVRHPNETWNSYQDSYLAFNCAHHSRTHKHADDLSLVWFEYGRDILVDAGCYGFLGKTTVGSELWKQGFWYSDPGRVFVESTIAHNTVEIDGRNFTRRNAIPYGSALMWADTLRDGVYCMVGEAKHFSTILHRRILLFRPSEFLLVLDWLHDDAQGQHCFRQWFHLSDEWEVEGWRTGYRGVEREGGSQLRPLHIMPLLPHATPSPVYRGSNEPFVGWHSKREGELLPNPSLHFQLSGDIACFATLLSFGDMPPVVGKATRIGRFGRTGRLRWRQGEQMHDLQFDLAQGGCHFDYECR